MSEKNYCRILVTPALKMRLRVAAAEANLSVPALVTQILGEHLEKSPVPPRSSHMDMGGGK